MSDLNRMQRERLAAKNQAMPDGGFPIRNISDLKNAIQAYGRATNKPAVKAWIKKRARELGAEDILPESWRTDEIKHYGVKGMKWGVRRYQNEDGSYTNAGKKRYAKAVRTNAKGNTTVGVHLSLSNDKRVQQASKNSQKAYDNWHKKTRATDKNDTKENRKAEDKAYKEWKTVTDREISNIVGKYGKKKMTLVNDFYGTWYRTSVNDVISNAILDNNFNDYYQRHRN